MPEGNREERWTIITSPVKSYPMFKKVEEDKSVVIEFYNPRTKAKEIVNPRQLIVDIVESEDELGEKDNEIMLRTRKRKIPFGKLILLNGKHYVQVKGKGQEEIENIKLSSFISILLQMDVPTAS